MFKVLAMIGEEFKVVGGALTWKQVEIIRQYWPESIVIREEF